MCDLEVTGSFLVPSWFLPGSFLVPFWLDLDVTHIRCVLLVHIQKVESTFVDIDLLIYVTKSALHKTF